MGLTLTQSTKDDRLVVQLSVHTRQMCTDWLHSFLCTSDKCGTEFNCAGRQTRCLSTYSTASTGQHIAQLTAMLLANAYLCIIHGVIRGICNSLKVDHADLLGLPNPVGSCNGLLLILGVGVGVIYHNCVCCLQV